MGKRDKWETEGREKQKWREERMRGEVDGEKRESVGETKWVREGERTLQAFSS